MTQQQRIFSDRLAALEGKFDHAIHGNGNSGLKTDVAVLRKTVSELAVEIGSIRKIIWLAAGATAIGAGGLPQLIQLIGRTL
jgi:hypothetical protein